MRIYRTYKSDRHVCERGYMVVLPNGKQTRVIIDAHNPCRKLLDWAEIQAPVTLDESAMVKSLIEQSEGAIIDVIGYGKRGVRLTNF